MTRETQLEMALRSVSSHALALLAWQRSGADMPDAVLASSAALFRAAFVLADPPEPEPEQHDADLRPCPHPPEQRISFGAAGCSDFQCRLCGESVAVPHPPAASPSRQEP